MQRWWWQCCRATLDAVTDFFDLLIVFADINSHLDKIAAIRVADQADTVIIFEFAAVLRIVEMLYHLVTVFHGHQSCVQAKSE